MSRASISALMGLVLCTSVSFAVPSAAGEGSTAGKGVAENVWVVHPNSSLKATLEAWAHTAGWVVIWDNPADYRLRAPVTFEDDFLTAVGRLSDAVHNSNPELVVTLYKGNEVIHVSRAHAASN